MFTHSPAQNMKVPLFFYIIATYLFIETHNFIWIMKPLIKVNQRTNMQWMLVLFFALDNPCDVLGQSSVGPFSRSVSTSPWSWGWEQRYRVPWYVFFSVSLSVSNLLLEPFSNHISSKNLSLIALGYIGKKVPILFRSSEEDMICITSLALRTDLKFLVFPLFQDAFYLAVLQTA